MSSPLRSTLTPQQLAAARAHEAATRKSRARPGAQPQIKLDSLDRITAAYMAHLGLWSKTAIADAFGVSRKALNNAINDHPRRST